MGRHKYYPVTCEGCSSDLMRRLDTWSGLCRSCTVRQRSFGNQNPFFGKHHSKETKVLMQIRHVVRGANHWNWKGGITTQDKLERLRFRNLLHHEILLRDNYTCAVCQQVGGSLQVDHIQSWSEYPELRFDANNCRTLCMACHYYVTFKKLIPTGIVWGHNLSERKTS